MGIDDFVGAHGRPARALGLFLNRAHSRPLLVNDHEELERGLALCAGDAHDPRGLELAEHANVGTRVIGSADAALVVLRLVAEESEDVHFRSSIPGRFNGRPVRQARNAYWSARSSTCLSSGLPMPWPASRSTRRSTTASGSSLCACNKAAIFRACIGSTRLSPSPVVDGTGGYRTPART